MSKPTVVDVEPDSPAIRAVIALHKTAKATLGFLRRDRFCPGACAAPLRVDQAIKPPRHTVTIPAVR